MALINDQSILMSIKKLLNVDEEDSAFDTDIGILINSEFMTLSQLGIGPAEGFYINEADTTWAEFSSDKTLIETVKSYIYMKVRMVFDPPASSVVADAFNGRIHELEFRLNCQAERDYLKPAEIIPAEQSEEDTPSDGSGTQTEQNSSGGSSGGSNGVEDGVLDWGALFGPGNFTGN